MSRLNEGFVRPDYPEQVVHSYYQASLVFDLIESRWGFDAVLAMLHGYREGRTTDQLIPEVLGESVEEFDDTFDDFVKERFGAQMAAVQPLAEGVAPGAASLDDLRRRARQQPGSFQARLQLGGALLAEGSLDEAEEELQAAIDLFPEYGGADSPYLFLARLYRDRDEPEQAADALHKLGERNENLYQSHVEEAEILLELGRPALAADALEKAVEVFPYDIEIHQDLAALYTQLGSLDGAVLERKAVVALDPVDKADAHYQLARTMFEAGSPAQARREVLRALEIAPTFDIALELLLELRGGAR